VPLYEYYCSDCQSKFELLVSYDASGADDIVCARCHGGRVRKLLSVFARPRAVAAGDAFGDYSDYGDYDETGADSDFGGSCACGGGGCNCQD
jgi:putative FmdB family regulatory protein